jgi:general secretion pathway protein A
MGDPIYEEFYGLREQPFAISTDPRFHFFSASHQTAYQELTTGLQRGEPLLLLTGEAGTGKTTLSRAVLAGLGDRTFAALVLNPYMSGGEILKLILRDFGLISREHLRQGALARAEPSQLLETLEGFLLTISAVKSRAVVIIDEAQSLAAAALDQVRLLTALERHGHHLIQVIFCGQPKLLDTLKKDNMYALNERITRRVHLGPLLDSEIRPYVDHRIAVAGGADRLRFDDEAVQLLADMSRGLPRRVNVLADRALQEGRVEQAAVITGAMVKRAARLLAGPQQRPAGPVPAPPPAAAPAPAPRAETEPQLVTPPKIQLAPVVPPPPAESAPAEPVSIFASFGAPAEPPAEAPPAPAVGVFAAIASEPPADADALQGAPALDATPLHASVTQAEDNDFVAPPFQELEPKPVAPATPEPTFTLEVQSRRSGRSWKLALGALALALAGVFGYGYYTGTILETAGDTPAAPGSPMIFTTRPAAPIPTPTWTEATFWIEDLRRTIAQGGWQMPGLTVRQPGGGAPSGGA